MRSRSFSSLRAAADEKVATPTTAGKTEGRQRQTSVNIVNNQGEEEFCLLDKESGEIIYLTKVVFASSNYESLCKLMRKAYG